MLRLKIFVRVQTFRQAPLARLRNSCHPALGSAWRVLSPWFVHPCGSGHSRGSGQPACLKGLVSLSGYVETSVLSSASLDGFSVLLIKHRLPDVIDYLYVGREDYKTDGWPLKQNLMTYNDEAMNKCFTSDWVKINMMIMPMIPSLTKPPPDPYSVLSFLLGGQKERQPDNNLRGACVLWFSEVNGLKIWKLENVKISHELWNCPSW